MNFIYNIAIGFYALAARTVALNNKKAKQMTVGQKQTLDIIRENFSSKDRPIWIHASSLGEFEQGRPMIEMIRKQYPDEKILLTFFSPSGYEVRKDYNLADAVCYLPFDTPGNARKFVELVNPKMVVFVKYEFWGNYLEQLKKRNIPTFLISSIFREGQSFFRKFGGTFRKMLDCFTTIFVQDEHSKDLLRGINRNNVEVAGDTRFDRVKDILSAAKQFPAIEDFSSLKLTLIMGSSWLPDEEIVIEYFNSHPEINLVIAPHVINEGRMAEITSRLKRKCVRYTQLKEGEKIDADCLIIDCFGILSSCYKYGNVAYIGGGFGTGIHNINEAAVYGMPVMFGPKHYKFKEASDLLEAGGAFEINAYDDFAKVMDKFLNDASALEKAGNASKEYITKNLGATQRIFDRIKKYI